MPDVTYRGLRILVTADGLEVIGRYKGSIRKAKDHDEMMRNIDEFWKQRYG